jgi:hypothetical protein
LSENIDLDTVLSNVDVESKEPESGTKEARKIVGRGGNAAAAVGICSAAGALKSSTSVVKSALTAVKIQTQGSDSFKNLFHSDADQKTLKSADDLFMRIAGARYTLK